MVTELVDARPGTLTLDFLKVLRDPRARTVLARHDPQEELENTRYLKNSTGRLVACLEDSIFGERTDVQISFELPSMVYSYTNHGFNSTARDFDPRRWISGIAHCSLDPAHEMRALRDFVLKPNDQLSLYWLQDNNNENHNEVKFHHDQCFLVVERGRKIARFLIGDFVGPDNTARMVQRNYAKPY